ncbi:MAG: hypothetical protein K2G04_07415, partial [Oscillospiraceae bacterium]|nr:hypothetical protein [Oscillospiraceae bacterium]
LLKRLRAVSKDSFFPTRISAILFPPFALRQRFYILDFLQINLLAEIICRGCCPAEPTGHARKPEAAIHTVTKP